MTIEAGRKNIHPLIKRRAFRQGRAATRNMSVELQDVCWAEKKKTVVLLVDKRISRRYRNHIAESRAGPSHGSRPETATKKNLHRAQGVRKRSPRAITYSFVVFFFFAEEDGEGGDLEEGVANRT